MDDRSVKRLQAHLKLAISISLSIGLAIGSLKVVGFGLENITATLLGAVAISRLRITTSLNVKPVFFILFIFTIGYGVGPQFVGGFMEEGPRQIGFSLVLLILFLLSPVLYGKLSGFDFGYVRGLYAGLQTIAASISVASDQIARLDIPAEQPRHISTRSRSVRGHPHLQHDRAGDHPGAARAETDRRRF
jgi:putative transport protein